MKNFGAEWLGYGRIRRWVVVATVLLPVFGVLSVGCGPVKSQTARIDASGDEDVLVGVCQNHPNQVVCEGTAAVTCGPNGEEVSREDCAPQSCVEGVGCALCFDGQTTCDGNTQMVCAQDLMSWEVGQVCDPNQGEVCDPDVGACVSMCDVAAQNKDNVGCEYVAVDMANWPDPYGDEHCFVVLVSNVQPEGTAIVTVEDENGTVLDFPGYGIQRQVAPGEMAVLVVTGTAGKCSDTPARPNAQSVNSGFFPGTVFVVKSSIPVVAYQVNPYEAALAYSTDASLLIPTAALGDQYMVFSYASQAAISPGSMSIVAIEDNTTVTVSPSVDLQAGGPVPATGTFDASLNAYEHLQIMATDGDLTSTLVTATHPVAVFSGSVCATIPYMTSCCDHIEEQMPPINSWGWTYVAAMPAQRYSENVYWRIMAAVDNTAVTFDPLSQYDTVLNSGEWVEIDTNESFMVSSAVDPLNPDPDTDPPILVLHYLKGAQQTGTESGGLGIGEMGNRAGDPAMALSVPVEQYLNEYIFLADPTYAYNFVVVVRTDPTEPIHLDCFDPIPDDRFDTITGDFSRAVITLKSESGAPDGTCTSGARRIWSASPFAIWVYGYFECTSYAYPGGMGLEVINDVVVVE